MTENADRYTQNISLRISAASLLGRSGCSREVVRGRWGRSLNSSPSGGGEIRDSCIFVGIGHHAGYQTRAELTSLSMIGTFNMSRNSGRSSNQ